MTYITICLYVKVYCHLYNLKKNINVPNKKYILVNNIIYISNEIITSSLTKTNNQVDYITSFSVFSMTSTDINYDYKIVQLNTVVRL